MSGTTDLTAILAPIPGDSPAGVDLRYDPVYEEIREARRAEDPLATGGDEPKRSDWEKVGSLSVKALATKTKDLQVAAWLAEALIHTEGFEGFAVGLRVLTGLLETYWDTLHPAVEEGDLESRVGPLEFMNEKLWMAVKSIPLTDPRVSEGYPLLRYSESRTVGYEKDTLNQYGDVDEGKAARRKEMIAEGKLTAEAFDAAVAKSSRAFYESLFASMTACREAFDAFEKVVDASFGRNAPRLAELRTAIEECEQFMKFRMEEKKKSEPSAADRRVPAPSLSKDQGPGKIAGGGPDQVSRGDAALSSRAPRRGEILDSLAVEEALWGEALALLESSGIKKALELLVQESYTAPSVRERNRLRLLMAKLCLRAGRPDLTRPIIEELHALIQELHLEKWESPLWVADVLDTLYQCLTTGEPSDEDRGRAKTLFQQMCTTDVTRAMLYKG
ncbi:MAG TPA: type VI secretion system protein TssA [Candidatus Methylomirabilis sp.]|nr:type VI secretion system protein TssA [Candidatus Methylomirabilis sp.]